MTPDSEKALAKAVWDVWREEHDSNARIYREDLKEVKQDVKDIKQILSNLHCSCHEERMSWIQKWVAMSFVYTSGLAVWFRWIFEKFGIEK